MRVPMSWMIVIVCSRFGYSLVTAQRNPNDVVNPYHQGPSPYHQNYYSQISTGYQTRASNFLKDQDIARSQREYQEILKEFDPSFKQDVTYSPSPRNSIFQRAGPQGKDLQGYRRMMALRKAGLGMQPFPKPPLPTTYSYGSFSPNAYSYTSGFNYNDVNPYQDVGMDSYLRYGSQYPQLHDITGSSLYPQRLGNPLNSVSRNPRIQGKSLLGDYYDLVALSDYDLPDYYKDDGNENYDVNLLPMIESTTARPTGLGLYRKSAIKLGKLVLDSLKLKN